jgi:heme-degrading monooxygenase HmoA
MFAVIFEVAPRPAKSEEYLQLAASLRPELEKIDGFVEIERFASGRTPGRFLSLSIWRDEQALSRWRTLDVHRVAQQKGRSAIFADYRLRVGEIASDPCLPDPGPGVGGRGAGGDGARGVGVGAPVQRQRLAEIEAGEIVTISEFSPSTGEAPVERDPAADVDPPAAPGMTDREVFASLYSAGKSLILASWNDAAAAARWRPSPIAGGAWRQRRVRIIRDYGMFDRDQAPQYYPPIRPTD